MKVQNIKINGPSSPLTKMSRPRREPEGKSLRAAANSPPDTLGRLSLSPQLAIAVALGAGQGVLVQAGTKQMHSLTYAAT